MKECSYDDTLKLDVYVKRLLELDRISRRSTYIDAYGKLKVHRDPKFDEEKESVANLFDKEQRRLLKVCYCERCQRLLKKISQKIRC